jgi:hypothetical protein
MHGQQNTKFIKYLITISIPTSAVIHTKPSSGLDMASMLDLVVLHTHQVSILMMSCLRTTVVHKSILVRIFSTIILSTNKGTWGRRQNKTEVNVNETNASKWIAFFWSKSALTLFLFWRCKLTFRLHESLRWQASWTRGCQTCFAFKGGGCLFQISVRRPTVITDHFRCFHNSPGECRNRSVSTIKSRTLHYTPLPINFSLNIKTLETT